MKARALFAVAALSLIARATPVSAHADFIVRSADGAGEGFEDDSPRSPVGGNSGTTLGEQRLIAVQHAADLWGELIDSDVPIIIEATFDSLGCSGTGLSTAAQAATTGYQTGITGDGADPSLLYPDALANRLAGEALTPDAPSIVAYFNSDYDDGTCAGDGWYYGLDGKAGMQLDVVSIALHELGHGLGVTHTVSTTTGQLSGGQLDAFAAHVFDDQQGKSWSAMTDAERLASFGHARQVVWDGEHVTNAASSYLDEGAPLISTTPAVPGLSGLVSDAAFGPRALDASVSARLVIGDPMDGCDPPVGSVSNRIVLLRPVCRLSDVAQILEAYGAVGVLMVRSFGWDSPPPPLDGEATSAQVGIPALGICEGDAQALEAAVAGGTVDIGISADAGRLLGADDAGRVYLHALTPPPGDLSHFDTLARPSLLMEPVADPPLEKGVDLTLPLLIDMGWTPFCGNGRIDQEEECDAGEDNDDVAPDACRTTCEEAGCGDGVKDDGEACDDGQENSDRSADACRTTCEKASCGDGTVDGAEECDDGEDNGDAPDACRSDCVAPSCGDGVVDSGEECDAGDDNDDTTPDACRTSCDEPRCGDGVVDGGEECDAGEDNDDAAPDACRTSCDRAHCGDGVLDTGEVCDAGEDNDDAAPDACRTSCDQAHCGDGVRDRGEDCDEGATAVDCKSECTSGAGVTGTGGTGGAAAAPGSMQDSSKHDSGGGCGCRVLGTSAHSSRARLVLGLTPWLLAPFARSATRRSPATRARRRRSSA